MAACCGCCSALKPRYKRLVDSIFPESPEHGLVKNNMEKLTYYCVSSPEKLDRIGEYLAQRLNRDVHRHRIGFVFIAMDALDQLLVSCHAHRGSLNMFVESFLKMVQKLLECDDPDLQNLATASFVKFANIEEDTPSYHRRYDFFVSKFSSMCHSNSGSTTDWIRIRGAGLRGIQGVVRKTVSDELQVNIWEPVHMDKIVPSLLFNMHEPGFVSVDLESPRDEEHPSFVAEMVFRDLVCRASYGNIKSVLRPVLIHLDLHELWVPNEFAIKCFKIIMYSVQQQYAYLVIQTLLSHLDKQKKSSPGIKASVVDVLYESVLISAEGSIGPSVLDIFNTLLRHLQISLDNKSQDPQIRSMEMKFEESTINAIGEFAKNLPDYQKIEVMMFVMGKFPQFAQEEAWGSMHIQLQTMLLKTLLKVATKYKTCSLANAFPPEFLNPLLRLSLLDDPGMRIIVQEILHTLIDRHDNTQKLRHVMIPKDIAQLDLIVEKVPRQDMLFMKKSGMQFYWHIIENMQMDTNRVDNFEALYCTMGLISIEMGGEDILVELFRLALDIQQLATSNASLPATHRCAVHGLVASYFNLITQLSSCTPLCNYISKVLDTRQKDAPHLLPDFAFNRANRASSSTAPFDTPDSKLLYPSLEGTKDEWLFNQSALSELITASGLDATRLATPFTQKPFTMDGMSHSVSDIQSINIELESLEGSPGLTRKEEITVKSLKKMLDEDSSESKEEQDKKRLEIVNTFRTAPFEEIVARSEAKSNHFHNKLNEILDMVAKPQESPGTSRKSTDNAVPLFEMQFPDLFVY